MATPRNRLVQRFHAGTTAPTRSLFRDQAGWDGDKKSAYSYRSIFERSRGTTYFPSSGVIYAQDAGNSPGQFIINSSEAQAVYNKAYSRFQGKVRGDQAQLGATLGEYGSSSRMVKNRAESIYTFTRNTRLRWAKLPVKKKRLYRQFSDYWLEYSFGWAPLFGDLFNAYQQLCRPINRFYPVRAGAATTFEYFQNLTGNPITKGFYSYRVLIFGEVSMTNPNTALLANLGLLNPAAIAWELVPYSFVADWMFDIGGFIGSWSDNFGFEYKNSGVNAVQIGSRIQTWDFGLGSTQCTSVVSDRTLGISYPLPNLAVLSNIGKNLKRALNALALTGQLIDSGFPPKRVKRRGSR